MTPRVQSSGKIAFFIVKALRMKTGKVKSQ
jgi:hypothetical protein